MKLYEFIIFSVIASSAFYAHTANAEEVPLTPSEVKILKANGIKQPHELLLPKPTKSAPMPKLNTNKEQLKKRFEAIPKQFQKELG